MQVPHLLSTVSSPCSGENSVNNEGHRSQEVDVIRFPFLFPNTLRVGDIVHGCEISKSSFCQTCRKCRKMIWLEYECSQDNRGEKDSERRKEVFQTCPGRVELGWRNDPDWNVWFQWWLSVYAFNNQRQLLPGIARSSQLSSPCLGKAVRIICEPSPTVKNHTWRSTLHCQALQAAVLGQLSAAFGLMWVQVQLPGATTLARFILTRCISNATALSLFLLVFFFCCHDTKQSARKYM